MINTFKRECEFTQQFFIHNLFVGTSNRPCNTIHFYNIQRSTFNFIAPIMLSFPIINLITFYLQKHINL